MALPDGSETVPDSVPPETCAWSAAGKAIAPSKIIAANAQNDGIFEKFSRGHRITSTLEAED